MELEIKKIYKLSLTEDEMNVIKTLIDNTSIDDLMDNNKFNFNDYEIKLLEDISNGIFI